METDGTQRQIRQKGEDDTRPESTIAERGIEETEPTHPHKKSIAAHGFKLDEATASEDTLEVFSRARDELTALLPKEDCEVVRYEEIPHLRAKKLADYLDPTAMQNLIDGNIDYSRHSGSEVALNTVAYLRFMLDTHLALFKEVEFQDIAFPLVTIRCQNKVLQLPGGMVGDIIPKFEAMISIISKIENQEYDQASTLLLDEGLVKILSGMHLADADEGQ